jgi:hypothetical protein
MKFMDAGPFPAEIACCMCPKAWAREMKQRGGMCTGEEFPPHHAHATRFWLEGGYQLLVVTFTREILEYSLAERVGYAVHEATHVWQWIVEHMNELSTGDEMEAHTIQWITQWLIEQLQEVGWMRR